MLPSVSTYCPTTIISTAHTHTVQQQSSLLHHTAITSPRHTHCSATIIYSTTHTHCPVTITSGRRRNGDVGDNEESNGGDDKDNDNGKSGADNDDDIDKDDDGVSGQLSDCYGVRTAPVCSRTH